jgi:hypothetical protein
MIINLERERERERKLLPSAASGLASGNDPSLYEQSVNKRHTHTHTHTHTYRCNAALAAVN